MPVDAAALARHLAAKDYAALEAALSAVSARELPKLWAGFKPLERLIVFKLLDAERALAVFELLPLEEKYFLFGGFPLAAIAPVLEDLPLMQRRHFVQLPRDAYERMYRSLLDASREIKENHRPPTSGGGLGR